MRPRENRAIHRGRVGGPWVMVLALQGAGSRVMEVSCPACAARYTADDEMIRGKTARMRCRACETVWLVGEDEVPSERRAAVMRRGAARARADLFAPRESEHGMVGPTIPPPG